MKPNASIFDSVIYGDIFSSQPMREVWSDEARIQRYLDFERALASLASKHRDTPMIGRSNLQQAISMTFGYKVAVWLAGIERHRERLKQLKPRVLVGEVGGAVGTLA